MVVATAISVLGFGIANLIVALIADRKTKGSKSHKKDMAQKSMIAIVIALFMLLIPMGLIGKHTYDPLSTNDLLFYLLMCVFGKITRFICKWLFVFLDGSKSENYDEELSVILLLACIGLSALCLVLRGYEWCWAYLSVAIGRFLWLDSTCRTLWNGVFDFLKQLSWIGWYGTFNVLMVVVAVFLEKTFKVQIEFPIIGIALSSIGYILWKHFNSRKENLHMTRKEFLQNHWMYYLMLEKKFINTTMYVEVSTLNYSTFSNEYASLLQLVGAELDSFFKAYCGYDAEAKKTIADYARYILTEYPDIKNQEIEVMGRDIIIKPFENWDSTRAKQSLPWWEAFDNIKHNRIGNKADASLENVLHILAALFLLEMKHLSKISAEQNVPDIPDEESSIFTLKDWSFKYVSMEDAMFQLVDGAIALGGGGADSV